MSNVKFKAKQYRLTGDRSGLAYIIKTGKNRKLLVFDEEKGLSRPIRHCPNEQTIYADKQSEFAFVEPLWFMHGLLEVPREKQITQQFLDNHPHNTANGGSLFEEINDEKEAEIELRVDDIKIDIYNAIREVAAQKGGEYKLEAVVAVLEDSIIKASKLELSGLKRRLYREVESDWEFFTDDSGNVTIFEDDYISRKYFVLRALREGIIKKSPNNKSMAWVRDGKLIATAPRGVELTDFFTDFLATEDGMLVGEEIKRRS